MKINFKDIVKLYTTNPVNPDDPNGIRDYFLKIIEVIPNNMYWLNRECITLGCNQNVLDLIGLNSLEEFVGITYEEMGKLAHWTEGQAQSFKHDDMEVMSSGKPKLNVLEPPLYDDEGNPVYYMSSRVPLFDDRHNVIGVVGISVDITARIKAEEVAKHLIIEKERTHLLEVLGGSIAHELRTPLASIRLASKSLIEYLPFLIEFYESHKDEFKNGDEEEKISEKRLKQLKNLPQSLINSTTSAFFIIDMLLTNINEAKVNKADFKTQSINQNIDTALYEYPFSDLQSELIHWNKSNDFLYEGSELLTKHVLFNLIKNALYYIAEAQKGEIHISLDIHSNKEFNQLIFKDTSKGISEDHLPHIFEKFHSHRCGGTGLGLAFCKLVMKTYNGKIECRSKEGEYTEFILNFPKLENTP